MFGSKQISRSSSVPLSISELTSKNHPSAGTIPNASLLPAFQTSSWTKGSSIDISLCPLAANIILPLVQCLSLATQQYFPIPLLLAPFHPECPFSHLPRRAFDRSTSRPHLVLCRKSRQLSSKPAQVHPSWIQIPSLFPVAACDSALCSTAYTRFPARAPWDLQSRCHSYCSVQTCRQKAGACEPRTRFTCCGQYQQMGSAEISDGPQFRLACPFPAPDYTASLMPVSADR